MVWTATLGVHLTCLRCAESTRSCSERLWKMLTSKRKAKEEYVCKNISTPCLQLYCSYVLTRISNCIITTVCYAILVPAVTSMYSSTSSSGREGSCFRGALTWLISTADCEREREREREGGREGGGEGGREGGRENGLKLNEICSMWSVFGNTINMTPSSNYAQIHKYC